MWRCRKAVLSCGRAKRFFCAGMLVYALNEMPVDPLTAVDEPEDVLAGANCWKSSCKEL